MSKKWAGIVTLAALLVLVLGGFYYLGAQMGGGMGKRPAQGGGQEGMERPPMGMMGGGGGGAAMVVYEKYIYVLSGPALFKIDPSTMKIEKELMLKPKQLPGAQKRPAALPEDEE